MRITPPAITPDQTDRASGRDVVIAEWTVHLLRQDPRKLWGVLAGTLAASVLGWMTFGGWIGAVLGAVLVLSAVAEFLLPIRYRLTSQQATCSYGLARLGLPWSAVRRVIDAGDSVRLSPFRRPSRLDAFRGVLIRFGSHGSSGDREAVMAIVRQMVPRSASEADTPPGGEASHAR